jgi:hypothetical protein
LYQPHRASVIGMDPDFDGAGIGADIVTAPKRATRELSRVALGRNCRNSSGSVHRL